MDNRTQQQRLARQRQLAERQKYRRIQQILRIGAIVLALVLSFAALMQSCATRKAVQDVAAQLRAKKVAQAQEEILARTEPSAEPTLSPAELGTPITLSFVGNVTLGVDANQEDGNLMGTYYENEGSSYFFQNVKSVFEGDDLTAASLVGSLSYTSERRNWDEAYLATPDYTNILTAGGIDAVSIANEHWLDFYEEGYVDTLANLDTAGIARFGFENIATVSVGPNVIRTPTETSLVEVSGGIRVGLVGVWQKSEMGCESIALKDIEILQEQGADLIVVMIQWESSDLRLPDDKQILMAHKFIDSGADAVIGFQPGVIQGVECYHDKYIAYSVGTFLTALPEPESTDSVIFQQTFYVSDAGAQGVADLNIIPCSVSSVAGKNDCRPTPLTGSDASRVLDQIYDISSQMDGGIQREGASAPVATVEEAAEGSALEEEAPAEPEA